MIHGSISTALLSPVQFEGAPVSIVSQYLVNVDVNVNANNAKYIGPSGCVCCHGNKVSTINGVFFSLFSPPGYFSLRRGYCRVPKCCMGS